MAALWHYHAVLMIIIFVVMAPIQGYAQLKFTSKAATIRNIHRWSGRITLALILIIILSWLSLVGII
ncbi:hypothetical protein C5S39_03205 [Candidatus Methanophagaceae archaeon]|jgi:hypothetical protein|nr:hypothetical protein C5S39_03205 [Methanophagales archaeon]